MAGKKSDPDLNAMSETELRANLRATREARRLTDLKEETIKRVIKAQKAQKIADAKAAVDRVAREAADMLTADYVDVAKALLALPDDWQRPGDRITEEDKKRARMVFDACQRDRQLWTRLSQPGSVLRPLGRAFFPENPDAMFETGWFTDNDTDNRQKEAVGLTKHQGSWYAADAHQLAWGREHMAGREETQYAGVPPERMYERFMEVFEPEKAEKADLRVREFSEPVTAEFAINVPQSHKRRR